LNYAFDLDAPFRAQAFGSFIHLVGQILGIENDLDESRPVTQIDENDAAVITAPADPSGKGGGFTCLGGPQVATVLGFQRLNSSVVIAN
jgi:hypothetical protein